MGCTFQLSQHIWGVFTQICTILTIATRNPNLSMQHESILKFVLYCNSSYNIPIAKPTPSIIFEKLQNLYYAVTVVVFISKCKKED